MSIELSMDSSSYLNQPKSNEELESPVDFDSAFHGSKDDTQQTFTAGS